MYVVPLGVHNKQHRLPGGTACCFRQEGGIF